MDKQSLQLLITEIKTIVPAPLTNYGAAKLCAFPLSSLRRGCERYNASKDKSYQNLYTLCRQETYAEDKRPNTDKSHYVIESLNLSMTEGDIVGQKISVKTKQTVSPDIKRKQDMRCAEILKRAQERIRTRNKERDYCTERKFK